MSTRLAIFAITLVAGCYPKSAPPPGAPSADAVARAATRFPGVTAEALAQGRELFVAKCNACHDYPDLSVINDERWPKIVKRMGGKAHVTPTESDAILHFILASR